MRMQAVMQRETQQMSVYQMLLKQHIGDTTAQLETAEAKLAEVSDYPSPWDVCCHMQASKCPHMESACMQVLTTQQAAHAELIAVTKDTAGFDAAKEKHGQRSREHSGELGAVTQANGLLQEKLSRMHAEHQQQTAAVQVK